MIHSNTVINGFRSGDSSLLCFAKVAILDVDRLGDVLGQELLVGEVLGFPPALASLAPLAREVGVTENGEARGGGGGSNCA